MLSPRYARMRREALVDKYNHKFYILESEGSLLLVVRWILVLRTEYQFPEHDEPYLTCSYQTNKFYVYELDSDSERWVAVDTSGNEGLFLGGNQSVSFNIGDDVGRVRGWKKNSIYFTDDFWTRMDDEYAECNCYRGGYDIGSFNLGDGSIEEISRFVAFWSSPSFFLLPKA